MSGCHEEQWPAGFEALCLHPPYPRRRMVYLGPSRLALSYFETIGFTLPPNENPAGGWALTQLYASRAMDRNDVMLAGANTLLLPLLLHFAQAHSLPLPHMLSPSQTLPWT